MASPEHWQLVAKLRRGPLIPAGSIGFQREFFDRSAEKVPRPQTVRLEPVSGPGFEGEWFRSGRSPKSCVLYLHGGGFVFGSTRSHGPLISNLAKECGIDFLALNYPLAPEHPCPAAWESALSAYRWLLTRQYSASHIGLASDSAGGALALSCLMAMGREKLPVAACGLFLCPWLDLTLTAKSLERNASADPVMSREGLEEMAKAYRGSMPANDPIVSPVYGDFTGLPPLFVQTGTADSLEDDSHLCAERAHHAGVPLDLDLWPDMIHGWQAFAHFIPEGGAALTKAASFLSSELE